MSIYPRNGVLTGRRRIEVQRNSKAIVKFATSKREANKLRTGMMAGSHSNALSKHIVISTG